MEKFFEVSVDERAERKTVKTLRIETGIRALEKSNIGSQDIIWKKQVYWRPRLRGI